MFDFFVIYSYCQTLKPALWCIYYVNILHIFSIMSLKGENRL